MAVVRSWRRSRDGAAARTAPLVAVGLMALVSPPTQHPVLQVLVGLLVAHAVALPEGTDHGPGPAPARPGLAPPGGPAAVGLWALALICAAGLGVEGWTAFRPPGRASRFGFDYNYGVSALVQTPFGEGRWSARRSVAVFLPGGPVLVTRVVLPHDDLARAPVMVTISDGHAVLCRHEVRDHAPFECRVPMPSGRWPLVQLDVSRAWRTEAGVEQAALVSARFEP